MWARAASLAAEGSASSTTACSGASSAEGPRVSRAMAVCPTGTGPLPHDGRVATPDAHDAGGHHEGPGGLEEGGGVVEGGGRRARREPDGPVAQRLQLRHRLAQLGGLEPAQSEGPQAHWSEI